MKYQSPGTATMLLHQFGIVSDQVNKEQLAVILSELEKILATRPDGAVVEFGCYIGTTSLFIRRLLNNYKDARQFHVYDSFTGLPPKTAADESRAGDQFQVGELAVSKKQFLLQFQKANLKPPVIHKGWFKDVTPAEVPDQIAFAFLDGDFYESIRDSLRLVLPRMQQGSTIVIDDYAREALPGAARAAHELLGNTPITTVHNLGIVHL
jgi:O-methyltransferase